MHRKILFEIIKLLSVKSTTENDPVTTAIEYLLKCEQKKSAFIPADVDISFVNDKWQKLIKCTNENNTVLFSRKYFEICMFSYIASSFKSGDLYVLNSEEFADYREQLLPWEDCEKIIQSYCDELTLPSNKTDFINSLKKTLAAKSENVDKTYPLNKDLVINSDNEITLKKNISNNIDKEVIQFRELIEKYMPERNIMEILCNVEHWINYTKHFGSLSGSEAKFKNSIERYILLVFGYDSNMGPTETSKHVRGNITPHMIHFTGQKNLSSIAI